MKGVILRTTISVISTKNGVETIRLINPILRLLALPWHGFDKTIAPHQFDNIETF